MITCFLRLLRLEVEVSDWLIRLTLIIPRLVMLRNCGLTFDSTVVDVDCFVHWVSDRVFLAQFTLLFWIQWCWCLALLLLMCSGNSLSICSWTSLWLIVLPELLLLLWYCFCLVLDGLLAWRVVSLLNWCEWLWLLRYHGLSNQSLVRFLGKNHSRLLCLLDPTRRLSRLVTHKAFLKNLLMCNWLWLLIWYNISLQLLLLADCLRYRVSTHFLEVFLLDQFSLLIGYRFCSGDDFFTWTCSRRNLTDVFRCIALAWWCLYRKRTHHSHHTVLILM